MKREFDLPPEDTTYLNQRDEEWETLENGTAQWLILRAVPVPNGYEQDAVDVALRIPPSYPSAGLDMAWFAPPLAREDGTEIPNTGSRAQIEGRTWQRWSRHRSQENPWRPGIDNVATHLRLVEDWLEREFEKRPA